jgi:Icc protein
LLVTGELADCGLDAEYVITVGLLARLPFPVFCIPGNHDRREPFRAAFAEGGYLSSAGALDYAVDRQGLRIIGLDSAVAGESHGALSTASLAFLELRLGRRRRRPLW